MTIKLVDLLIESIFEDTNTHPVYDEYLTNPQTGKKLKVKSALSSKQHPMYSTALAYIKDKTGSEHSELGAGTAQSPDIVMAPGEMGGDDEVTKISITSEFKDEANREETESAIEATASARDKITKHEELVNNNEKWNSLSPEFQKAAVISYRESERERFEGLQRVVDGYSLEELDVPEDILSEFEEARINVEDIEKKEEEESAADEEGLSLTDRFREEIDDEALKTFSELLGEPEQEKQGI